MQHHQVTDSRGGRRQVAERAFDPVGDIKDLALSPGGNGQP
jgi:hypothetical protein